MSVSVRNATASSNPRKVPVFFFGVRGQRHYLPYLTYSPYPTARRGVASTAHDDDDGAPRSRRCRPLLRRVCRRRPSATPPRHPRKACIRSPTARRPDVARSSSNRRCPCPRRTSTAAPARRRRPPRALIAISTGRDATAPLHICNLRN